MGSSSSLPGANPAAAQQGRPTPVTAGACLAVATVVQDKSVDLVVEIALVEVKPDGETTDNAFRGTVFTRLRIWT